MTMNNEPNGPVADVYDAMGERLKAQAVEVIDITPTWAQAAEVYVVAMQDGTAEGKRLAAEEIRRMGRMIDGLQAKAEG
jgi:hypothetical protein